MDSAAVWGRDYKKGQTDAFDLSHAPQMWGKGGWGVGGGGGGQKQNFDLLLYALYVQGVGGDSN